LSIAQTLPVTRWTMEGSSRFSQSREEEVEFKTTNPERLNQERRKAGNGLYLELCFSCLPAFPIRTPLFWLPGFQIQSSALAASYSQK
jgi:hypothetical protein